MRADRSPRFQAASPPTPVAAPPSPPVAGAPRRPTGGGVPSTFTAPAPRKTLAPEDRLTKDEAAAHAGVTRRTITRWIAQGMLNRYTFQLNRVAVSRRELDRLLRARHDDPQA